MSKKIVGVMGPGDEATAENTDDAYQVGRLLAQAGRVVLTGGRRVGVMDAALRGAKDGGGETIAILPSRSKSDASTFADIVIVTGMNNARNGINVLTSDVVVACGIGPGTLSEIALALKETKHVVLITDSAKAKDFLVGLSPSHVHVADSAAQAVAAVEKLMG